MHTIPSELRTKSIHSFIQSLVNDGAQGIEYLDDSAKATLTALAIYAYGGDVDIVLSSNANIWLAKYFLSNDADDAIEFRYAVKESAWEHFSSSFELLIQEQINLAEIEDLEESGKRPYMDKNNGETLWI